MLGYAEGVEMGGCLEIGERRRERMEKGREQVVRVLSFLLQGPRLKPWIGIDFLVPLGQNAVWSGLSRVGGKIADLMVRLMSRASDVLGWSAATRDGRARGKGSDAVAGQSSFQPGLTSYYFLRLGTLLAAGVSDALCELYKAGSHLAAPQ